MAGTSQRALLLGAAIAVLTALVCLAAVSARDPHTISLSELASLNSPLMSCESDSASSSTGDALLWCSDPNAPHCIPAAPEPPRIVLADRPDLDVSLSANVVAASFVLLPWPQPQVAALQSRPQSHRLERPPRA